MRAGPRWPTSRGLAGWRWTEAALEAVLPPRPARPDLAPSVTLPKDRTSKDARSQIEQSYDELCEELDRTDAAELVIPRDLTETTDAEVRTVVADVQEAAMDYAIASSLYPHVQIQTPPDGSTRTSAPPGMKVVKGRMSEPPPLGRNTEPMKIVKGSKIQK